MQVLQIIKAVAKAFVEMQEDTPPFYEAKLEYLCRMAPWIVAIEQSCPPHIDWKELVGKLIHDDLVARGIFYDPTDPDLATAEVELDVVSSRATSVTNMFTGETTAFPQD
jgi:hypothetical protein